MEQKLCPFRKETWYKAGNDKRSWLVPSKDAYYTEEVFRRCIEEKCAVWNKYYQQCGLLNKFN